MEDNNDIVEELVNEIDKKEDVASNAENVETATPEENQASNEIEDLKNAFKDLDEKYKRRTAEFENFKKRSQKEREGLYNMVTADVVGKILPALDNLENASKAATDDKAYQEGVEMVYKQFMDILTKFNVEVIETVGKTFDPEFHEAVSHVDDDTKGVQEIVQEYRKGYKIGTKVIRHSMVVVAN